MTREELEERIMYVTDDRLKAHVMTMIMDLVDQYVVDQLIFIPVVEDTE